MLPDNDCIELDGGELRYRIRASRRRRRLALELQADGALTVATPAVVPLALIRRFVLSQQGWISNQRARLTAFPPPALVLAPGAQLPYLDHSLQLDVDTCVRGPGRCRRHGDSLRVQAASPDAVPRLIERWYRQDAARHFAERITHFAGQVGTRPARLAVRAARTRWGSCSSRGTISLNWRLMLLPSTLLDYVVVHELCHLLVPNHSPRFWAQVARVLPDFLSRRAELRRRGRHLPF